VGEALSHKISNSSYPSVAEGDPVLRSSWGALRDENVKRFRIREVYRYWTTLGLVVSLEL
jgi:hypothetical protein